jgi:predicted nucleic acid-binding protein
MNGTTEAGQSERIYLDTNVFIEAVEGRSRLSELVTELLLAFPDRSPQRLVTSELTLSELIVKPIEAKRPDLVQVYDNWTISNPYLEVVPVVREVLRDAAILRANDKTLRLPDAIHLTTGRGTQCRYSLTKDKRIRGQFGVEILDLTEANIENLLRDDPNAHT